MLLYAGVLSRKSGTSERVFQVAEGLSKRHIKLILSSADKKNQISSTARFVTMPSHILEIPSVFSWLLKIILAVFGDQQVDVIQIESFSSLRSLVLILILRPFGKRFVVVFHDKYWGCDPRDTFIGRVQLTFQRCLLLFSDAVITPGTDLKRWFEDLHGKIATEKITVIPNGASDPENSNVDSRNLRKKYGIGVDSFVALFFGSMDFKPNHDSAVYLYKISELIARSFEKETGRRLVFAIAGEGSEVFPRTEYYLPLGYVENISELLSIPDVIVLPHFPSNSGPHMKTAIALLSRKPVIASDDAIKDIQFITPREHYLYFDVYDSSTLLYNLIELCKNKEMGEQIALNAYYFSKRNSWEAISLNHIKLYRRLLLEKNY